MWLGIAQVRPGARLGDIGAAIQHHAERHGFSVVREYCGHGVGRKFHEEPQVLHYGKAGTGIELKPGMIFTIEPMINAGRAPPRCCPTAGPSSPRIAASRRNGNTRCWSPTPAWKYSPSRPAARRPPEIVRERFGHGFIG